MSSVLIRICSNRKISWMHYNFNSSIVCVKRCFSNRLELTEGISKNIGQCEEFIHREGSQVRSVRAGRSGKWWSPLLQRYLRHVDVILTGMV